MAGNSSKIFFGGETCVKDKDRVTHSYILELKYLSAKDSDAKAKEQWIEAEKQLRRYANDRIVQQMTTDTELHLIRMQMRYTELLRIEEVSSGILS